MKFLQRKAKNISIIFIILCIISRTNEVSTEKNCNELYEVIFKDIEQIQTYIDYNIYELKQKSKMCIELLIKNGRLEALDYYLDELDKRRIKYKSYLTSSVNIMRKKLEEAHDKYRNEVFKYQTVYPAFQWAQSPDEVFIEVKFAHRHDSPGCLELDDLDVFIREKSVTLLGYCVLGDIPIKIDFSINTWGKLNYTESTHGKGSVGRYQFTLKKRKTSFWEKLLADGSPVPQNMRIWFAMKEKYEEQLKPYEKKKEESKEYDKIVKEIKQKQINKDDEEYVKRKTENLKKRKNAENQKNNTNDDNTKNEIKDKNNSTKNDSQIN